jgi:hypothetical protein
MISRMPPMSRTQKHDGARSHWAVERSHAGACVSPPSTRASQLCVPKLDSDVLVMESAENGT